MINRRALDTFVIFKAHNKTVKIILILLFFLGLYGNANAVEFSSGSAKVNLIELYTSEGCSSCPPADQWLSKLKNENGLWEKFIPMAFHVDYWDYLGWKDAFAEAKHAVRQQNYASHRHVSSVYTPAVMLNGRGWRGWRFFNDHNKKSEQKPGVLTASLTNEKLNVTFSSNKTSHSPLILNVALLGTNLKSHVIAGENEGEFFTHDFVVLKHIQQKSERVNQWQLEHSFQKTKATAIAIWINQKGDPTPIQATGGWLN